MNECYRFFDGRVKEIRANGEGEGDYYPGQYLEIHNILYVDILSYVWLEMAILVSFLVIFLMDYERICRTADLVYSSPKGREIQVRKLLVGLVHGMAASLLLLGGTLAVFFLIVPMEGLWEVPVTAPAGGKRQGLLAVSLHYLPVDDGWGIPDRVFDYRSAVGTGSGHPFRNPADCRQEQLSRCDHPADLAAGAVCALRCADRNIF